MGQTRVYAGTAVDWALPPEVTFEVDETTEWAKRQVAVNYDSLNSVFRNDPPAPCFTNM